MPVNDLAGSATYGPFGTEQLFAGERNNHTDAGISGSAVIAKYEVCKRTLGKTISRVADTTTDTGKDYVIVAQPIAGVGTKVPYYDGGHFNMDILVWPANLNTELLRKQFFNGTNISVSKLSAL